MAIAAQPMHGNVLVLEPRSALTDSGVRRRTARFRPRVLVLEPDLDSRLELVMGLAEAGFEVLAVESLEGLQVELGAERMLPHMVLLAAEVRGMHGEDAFEFCARLRQEPHTEQVPVFLLSSVQGQQHKGQQVLRAEQVRADACLSRPLGVADVVGLAWLHAGRSAAVNDAHSQWLPLPRLVGMLLAGLRTGRVELRDGRGGFSFHRGQVVAADWEGAVGEPALRRLALFGSGSYTVSFASEPLAGPLALGLERWRTELLPAVERFGRLRHVGVPLEARLVVNTQRLGEVGALVTSGDAELVELFDGERTVQAVLTESGWAEVDTLELTTRLYVLGVLDPLPAQPGPARLSAEPLAPAPAP